jgi:predicted phage-related endonuclease
MNAPQGSDAWRLARCGSIGASDAPRVVRRTKTGYSADRDSLMAAKVLERLTGQPVEIFKTQAMLQGTEREPEARMTYALIKGVEVEQVGLVPHPSIKGAHASPDGLVTEIGLVEIKCPQPAAHMDTLMGETISEAHVVQMHWQMACAGSQWCDYVSFNPEFPPAMQLWIRRVYRDAKFIAELEREISQFIKEVEQKVDRLSRRYAVAA